MAYERRQLLGVEADYSMTPEPTKPQSSGWGSDKPGDRCGDNVCDEGEYCCNESCGICAPEGGGCTKQFCGPVMRTPRPTQSRMSRTERPTMPPKTPKPTKGEKTPRPTQWKEPKTDRPTVDRSRTPRPTVDRSRTDRPTVDRSRTPRPTPNRVKTLRPTV